MKRKQHRGHSDNEHDGTEQDGCLVILEQVTRTSLVFLISDETCHHKDRIIDTYTEDECRDDDVDEIELDVKDHHCSEHNEPTKDDWQEAKNSVLDAEVETEEQHDEHKCHRHPLQDIEILIQILERVGRVIVCIEYQQVRMRGDGIADTVVVGRVTSH